MKIKHLRFKFFAISVGAALFLLTTAFIANSFISGNSEKQVNYYQSENEYLNSLRMNPATGVVNPADYAKALMQVQKLRANQPATKSTDLEWNNVGPDNMGGRMRSLVKATYDGTNYWYAGSISGGLWRLAENPNTTALLWSSVSTSARDLNVSCIYLADNGTMYVGTGESYCSEDFNLLPGFAGRGIFKSTNGVDFSVIPSTIPTENGTTADEWFYVNKITSANNKLFVGTNQSLRVSDMQGGSWTVAETKTGAKLLGECTELIAQNGSVVAFIDGLAYVSVNGDPSQFECISTRYYQSGQLENATMLPRDSVGRMCFAFAPSNPNYLYAVAINKYDIISTTAINERGCLKNIYLSIKGSNGWSDWKVIGPGGSTYMFYVFQSNGLYSAALTVDPTNEQKIYVGGNDMWGGNYIVGADYYQWTQLTTYQDNYWSYAPSNHFAYMFDSYGAVVIGCENGIYRHWPLDGLTVSCNTNLTTAQFYSVSPNFDDGVIIGGTQGNGTVSITSSMSLSGKSGVDVNRELVILAGDQNIISTKIGGYAHTSMIYPKGRIISINGNADLKTSPAYPAYSGIQRLVMYRHDGQMPQCLSNWYDGDVLTKPIEDYASYITPSVLWEDFNYAYSKDTAYFVADRNYSANDTVYAASKNANYPIEVILTQPLDSLEVIEVQDIVASKFFVGVTDFIFMTTEASNFTKDFTYDNPWFVISCAKVGGLSGTPQCMAVSKDANYLYVGTKDGKLYRIANIAGAYDSQTANAGTALYGTSPVVNPYCVVATHTIATFNDRIITSISVNPEDPEMVVVTLGNYGFDDYIYISTDALHQNPTFTKRENFAHAPLYTSLFVEGVDGKNNMLMVGSDFGIWSTENIAASISQTDWKNEAVGSIGEIPVFMLKQQNIQTDKGKPVCIEDDSAMYITNYRALYAATFGGGLFRCSDLVKGGGEVAGIDDYKPTVNVVDIYPNPARDYVNIELETQANVDVTLSIYNLSGKLMDVKKKRSDADKITFTVNTSNLPQGAYIAKIDIPNCKSKTSKFIVVK